jgi:hypothetical protein
MSWPGHGEQNWGQPGSYGGGDPNPYPLPGQGPYGPQGQGLPHGPLPGGPGGFPPPPPPPPRSGGGWVFFVLILAAAVVLVGGLVGVVIAYSSGNPSKPIASGSPTDWTSTSPQSSPSDSPTDSPTDALTGAKVPARIAGWQGVASRNHGVAYDVPPNWQVQSPGVIVGFEDDKGKPLVGMSGAAGIKNGQCTLVQTGGSGGEGPDTRSSAKVSDLPGTAQYAARRWANAGYTPKKGRAPTVRLSKPVSVRLGGMKGYHVTANVTVNGSRGPCDPPQAVVHAVAFPSIQGDPVVFITYADRGVSGAASDQDIAKAISSLRPLT